MENSWVLRSHVMSSAAASTTKAKPIKHYYGRFLPFSAVCVDLDERSSSIRVDVSSPCID